MNTSRYAGTVLRYTLGGVLLWFAFSQWMSPQVWYGFLPGWTEHFFISQHAFVLLNALFEFGAAIFLFLGLWVRPVAVLLGLHMAGIAATVGLTAVGVRDVGLVGAFFALAMIGSGVWALDEEEVFTNTTSSL